MRTLLLVSLLSLSAAACSTSDSIESTDTGVGDKDDDDEDEGATGDDEAMGLRDAGRDPTRDAGRDSAPTKPPPIDDDFEQCADTRVEAERGPRGTNVVWVIDTSGSMDREAQLVQENMNLFVQSITAAGLDDYRVVMVSQKSFVTVPDPLGSDALHFLHVEEKVGSSDPLEDLLNRFADYESFLLPGVITHFISVTDDESDLSASEFVTAMRDRLGGEFRANAIASPPGDTSGLLGLIGLGGCSGSYGDASSPGVQYWEAAAMTMGLTFSICSDDWSALFDTLAVAVGESAVPCALDLPEPPGGQTLDLSRINVVYTPAAATKGAPLRNVPSAAACGDEQGWHYDDAASPTGIVLCPGTCKQAASGGSLEMALGCTTVVQ